MEEWNISDTSGGILRDIFVEYTMQYTLDTMTEGIIVFQTTLGVTNGDLNNPEGIS